MPCLTHRLTRAMALLFALAMSVRAQDNEGPRDRQEVEKLVLRGVKHVDREDLEASIATQATGCRTILLMPFCLFSHSPTFQDKHYLVEDELRRDVVRIRLYYWKRGFRETTVDTSVTPPDGKRVTVTFTVNEGPATLIRSVHLSRDTSLIAPRIRDRVTLLHPGDRLDLIRLDSMRVLLQNELWNLGYGDAVVDTTISVDSVRRLADISFRLNPRRKTTVGQITINGNEEVSDRTILQSLTFGRGDLYRLSDVLESQRNLYESSLFRIATITVPPQRDSVKNVTIDVSEAPLQDARAGPGFNNVDFLQFQGQYTSYNFFGGARRLDVDLAVGNLFARQLSGRGPFRNVAADVPDSNTSPFFKPTFVASVDFRKPSFLRPSDEFGIGAFGHRSMNPGVFVDYGYGGQATFTHRVAPRAPVSISYRFEMNRVVASQTYFCVNYGVCDTLTIQSLRTHQALSPLTLTGYVDRSDAPFSPTKGYVARLDFEHASQVTQSDFRYNRLFFDGAVYDHRRRSRSVYSAHLRFGFAHALHGGTDGSVLHPRKRFYAGGANSVRGFAENQLGPRILTIDDSTLLGAAASKGGICALTEEDIQYCDPNAPKLHNRDFLPQPLGGTRLIEGSVEYRFPLGLNPTSRRDFRVAVFLDAGYLATGEIRGLASLSEFIKDRFAITPGAGLRYMSSLGPIRLDVGYNPRRSETLGVVTTIRNRDGALVLAPLTIPRHYAPGRRFFDRLVLHFSLGEAY